MSRRNLNRRVQIGTEVSPYMGRGIVRVGDDTLRILKQKRKKIIW